MPELLALWEQLGLPYVVVAQLCEPIKNLLRRGLVWQATEVSGTEVAEIEYRAARWPHPRRLVLNRHRVAEPGDRGGKRLLDVPGYRFQALVTSLPASQPPLAVWRDCNGRVDCENVTEGTARRLRPAHALPAFVLGDRGGAVAGHAHLQPQRALPTPSRLAAKVTIHTLRYWLFVTAGVLSHPQGKTIIKLAVPPRERGWWRQLWDKILGPLPNCNAVENQPVFAP